MYMYMYIDTVEPLIKGHFGGPAILSLVVRLTPLRKLKMYWNIFRDMEN